MLRLYNISFQESNEHKTFTSYGIIVIIKCKITECTHGQGGPVTFKGHMLIMIMRAQVEMTLRSIASLLIMYQCECFMRMMTMFMRKTRVYGNYY